MLKSLDQFDPLPDLSPDYNSLDHGLDSLASNRHKREWETKFPKDDIEIKPYLFQAEDGKLRYAPPLPPSVKWNTEPPTHNGLYTVKRVSDGLQALLRWKEGAWYNPSNPLPRGAVHCYGFVWQE